MDKELLEQFQLLASMIENLPTKDYVDRKVAEAQRHTEILIENTVTQRLDALTDGYKLNHEKQWELERELADLKRRVERLENVG